MRRGVTLHPDHCSVRVWKNGASRVCVCGKVTQTQIRWGTWGTKNMRFFLMITQRNNITSNKQLTQHTCTGNIHNRSKGLILCILITQLTINTIHVKLLNPKNKCSSNIIGLIWFHSNIQQLTCPVLPRISVQGFEEMGVRGQHTQLMHALLVTQVFFSKAENKSCLAI